MRNRPKYHIWLHIEQENGPDPEDPEYMEPHEPDLLATFDNREDAENYMTDVAMVAYRHPAHDENE